MKEILETFTNITTEKRGIYNVTFNDKNATPIKTDLEFIEDAIIAEVIMYVKGFHDKRRDKGMGAKHIKIHLDENSEGQITLKELLNLGNSIRTYLSIFKEAYIESNGAKLYEWQNDNGIRFRAVIDELKRKDSTFYQKQESGGPQLPLPPTHNAIITFYSDRNLKERMSFKNPQVEDYYQNELDLAKLANMPTSQILQIVANQTKQRRR